MTDNSTFTLKEKYLFWRKKWLCEHILSIIIFAIITVLMFVGIAVIKDDWTYGCFLPIVFIAEYMFFRNRMMIYIENKVYVKL